MGQLSTAFVEFGYPLRLEVTVTTIHVQHSQVVRDSSAGLGHHLGRACQLAAVNRDGLRAAHVRASLLVAQHQQ
jgi:hypothetical protein